MSHPKTYKAYGFTEKGGPLEQIIFDWKDPQQGEIVVKVLACGVCASDEIAKHQGMPQVTYPIVPGHEIVGDVVAIPPTEKKWKVGQRVGSGWHGGHCFACDRCAVGDYITCDEEDINGISRHGGYAEYVTVRTEAVVDIPDGMNPAEVAPLLCAGVTTFNSLRHMSCTPPDFVAVQGIGGLGHLAIQFAKRMGFRVVALSSSPAKEELATSLGAEIYIDGSKTSQAEALKKLGGARLIMCTAPNPEIIRSLLPALAANGELLVLAITEEASIPLGMLIGMRLSIRGWPSGVAADSEDCVKFVKAHGVKCLVETFPLDKANDAYDHRSSARFRAVIVP
ncbi:GroES-like protein [Laetiporus sulphureus 93-53]|uniref:GroES-like protein n=1 Tax=Laetiporus sulphureus 93-53 TaxID=1314785 RepID=A0A165CHD8_9APHY|nr:GroES-like protein [Laetiporus sulphureus 93-53]KZT02816.1 GroES-like protein [Laetiporus sulphureus 93-53]